jgi:hypothetical protein
MWGLLGRVSSLLQKTILRAYPNNPLYCGRLQSPMPALSAKNVLNVEKTTSSEHFCPAALASNFSLGLITTRLFG